jgi:hypothetical protein
MRLIKRMCKQKAVYWAPTTPGSNGKMKFAAPIALNVRWSDVQKAFLDVDGNKQLSMAKVFTLVDVLPLGAVWLTPLKAVDLDADAIALVNKEDILNPFLNDGAFEIRKFMKIPTISARQFVRISWL